jgi:hypothetical protein
MTATKEFLKVNDETTEPSVSPSIKIIDGIYESFRQLRKR